MVIIIIVLREHGTDGVEFLEFSLSCLTMDTAMVPRLKVMTYRCHSIRNSYIMILY